MKKILAFVVIALASMHAQAEMDGWQPLQKTNTGVFMVPTPDPTNLKGKVYAGRDAFMLQILFVSNEGGITPEIVLVKPENCNDIGGELTLVQGVIGGKYGEVSTASWVKGTGTPAEKLGRLACHFIKGE